jgi:cytoskeletal protein CcmA (bactofilin family)
VPSLRDFASRLRAFAPLRQAVHPLPIVKYIVLCIPMSQYRLIKPETLQVDGSLVLISRSKNAVNRTMGMLGTYENTKHSGMIRDAADGIWKFIRDYGGSLDAMDGHQLSSYAGTYADLWAANIKGSSGTFNSIGVQDVTISNRLTANGNVMISGPLTTSNISVLGDASVGGKFKGNVRFDNNVEIDDSLSVDGTAMLNDFFCMGNMVANGEISIYGRIISDLYIDAGLNVATTTSLNLLNVSGNATLMGSKTTIANLVASNNATFQKAVTIQGQTTLANATANSVTFATTTTGILSVGTASVSGNLFVNGNSYITTSTALEVENQYIIGNRGNLEVPFPQPQCGLIFHRNPLSIVLEEANNGTLTVATAYTAGSNTLVVTASSAAAFYNDYVIAVTNLASYATVLSSSASAASKVTLTLAGSLSQDLTVGTTIKFWRNSKTSLLWIEPQNTFALATFSRYLNSSGTGFLGNSTTTATDGTAMTYTNLVLGNLSANVVSATTANISANITASNLMVNNLANIKNLVVRGTTSFPPDTVFPTGQAIFYHSTNADLSLDNLSQIVSQSIIVVDNLANTIVTLPSLSLFPNNITYPIRVIKFSPANVVVTVKARDANDSIEGVTPSNSLQFTLINMYDKITVTNVGSRAWAIV